MSKKIYLGADHAGFKLKERIKKYFEKEGIEYEDVGNLKYDKNDDYPDYAKKVASRVVKEKTMGILICGTSFGVCIAANKVKGARAVNPTTVSDAKLSRQHNNANILCLAGNNFDESSSKKVVTAFMQTSFSKAKRHLRRIKKIEKMN